MKSTIFFKVDALIKMARTTTNDDLREQYIDEAYEIMTKEADNMANKVDQISQFVKDCLDFDGSTPRSEVYAAYLNWCKRNNVMPIGRNYFYNEMRRSGVFTRKTNGRYVANVTIKRGA